MPGGRSAEPPLPGGQNRSMERQVTSQGRPSNGKGNKHAVGTSCDRERGGRATLGKGRDNSCRKNSFEIGNGRGNIRSFSLRGNTNPTRISGA